MVFNEFLLCFTHGNWLIFLRIVNRFWFLFMKHVWNLNLFLFFSSNDSNNVADLTNCQCIDNWLIFFCYFNFLFTTLIKHKFSWKLMSRSGVTLRLHQNHSSTNCIWLFFQPFFCKVVQLDSYCTYLPTFCELDWDSKTLDWVNFYCSKRSFWVRAKMQDLTFFDCSFYNSSSENNFVF